VNIRWLLTCRVRRSGSQQFLVSIRPLFISFKSEKEDTTEACGLFAVIVIIKPHAEMRMLDRGVRETQVREVLENPAEIISVRYGRFAAHGKIHGKELVVIYEKKNEK